MMRKLLFSALLALATASTVHAGGLMTNTNYHIAFDRMFARAATTEIDAAYSNPAGLAWGHEGWQLSLNFQKPWQNRDIDCSVPGFLGSNFDKKYNGVASAPIVPALFAAYKKQNWAFSAMIGIVGSGGFVKYDEGIPMFEVPIRALLAQAGMMPDKYNYSSNMKGKQYIYGAQFNITRKINDNFSAAIGIRANYYDGYNRGFVNANMTAVPNNIDLIDLQLDCIQRGWGFAPIVSFDYHNDNLTVSARYEFRTKIATENYPLSPHQEHGSANGRTGALHRRCDRPSAVWRQGSRLPGRCRDPLRHALTAGCGRWLQLHPATSCRT